MNQIPETSISMGNYVVSPATHETTNGQYRASFSVQRALSKGGYCRIFRFDQEFASREAARIFAVTQGWLETCMARPALA
ncbi:hypothetical protein [Rhodoferax sp.]|uniref:hypothetical protein n=1 Tax=Rhodoferax sp. TaxID=50421 RepID=UPI002ACDE9E6|nr:hypothetical protein [Rhodoferax sp.]MDZ7921577.1 hypothetical protein [Rhodoferax sp.]